MYANNIIHLWTTFFLGAVNVDQSKITNQEQDSLSVNIIQIVSQLNTSIQQLWISIVPYTSASKREAVKGDNIK